MCEECVQDPLRGLLSKFEAQGMDVLGEFVSLSADNRPMTEEHKTYMAGRKAKYQNSLTAY